MGKLVTLEFNAGKLKFAIGHFTIFSATERETMHGHNYTLHAAVKAEMAAPGITFDYRLLDKKLISLCKTLHLRFLIPQLSPYLEIEEKSDSYRITFNNKTMELLKEDVILMPLYNISLEDLSQWFVDRVIEDKELIDAFKIKHLLIKVFNGPAHGAQAEAFVNG